MTDPVTQLPESFDTNKAISLSLGMASPLWLAFAGAAMAGSALWWMSRWTRPENLEAMFELPATPPAPQAVAETAAETAAVVEPMTEIAVTAAETVIDVAAQEVAAMAEGLADVDPVVETLAELTAAAEVAPVNDDTPVAAAVETVVAAAEKAADDLTRLVGIGPKLAASLAEQGVTSFAQIAAWTAEDLAKFDEALSLKGRAARDAWVAQARRFADA